ncbi:hypothetical protein HK096_003210 [Nowakowskiella sp. JEL0078]|nr:hypothetical protein HK096_003210 [Nowakowskiella sp. JEL0078]
MRGFTLFALIVLSSSANAAGTLGSWSVIGNTGVVCIIAAILPGPEPAGSHWKMMCGERPHKGNNPYPTNKNTGGPITSEVDVFNSTTPFVSTYTSRNPFCGGLVQMPDGRVFSVGGDRSTVSLPSNTEFVVDGRTARRIYTPIDQITGTVQPWTELPDMSVQRWYPSLITLNDGRILIVSGSLDNLDLANMTLTTKNPTYEYYPPLDNNPRLVLQILDRAHPWNLFPLVYQLPKSGNVFIFAGTESAILNPTTNAADETSIPPLNDSRTYTKIYPFTPTANIMPLTKKNNFTATIRLCGGTLINNQSAPYCFEINPESSGASWTETDPMPTGKVMPDVVILPDGKLIYTNGAPWGFAGGDGGQAYNAHPPSYATYLYDPSAPQGQRYTTMAPATVGRLYHSGALLAPDGRVVTFGNEMANWPDIEANRTECFPFNFTNACIDPFEYRVEAFEPPYFNVNNRVSVMYGKTARSTTHGSYIEVFLNKGFETRNITMANFIRYGSTTHSTNTDQRLVEADIMSKSSSGRLVIKVPSSAILLPPGNYMLWLLDENSIPAINSLTVLVSIGTADITTIKLDSGSGKNRVGIWTALLILFGVIWVL